MNLHDDSTTTPPAKKPRLDPLQRDVKAIKELVGHIVQRYLLDADVDSLLQNHYIWSTTTYYRKQRSDAETINSLTASLSKVCTDDARIASAAQGILDQCKKEFPKILRNIYCQVSIKQVIIIQLTDTYSDVISHLQQLEDNWSQNEFCDFFNSSWKQAMKIFRATIHDSYIKGLIQEAPTVVEVDDTSPPPSPLPSPLPSPQQPIAPTYFHTFPKQLIKHLPHWAVIRDGGDFKYTDEDVPQIAHDELRRFLMLFDDEMRKAVCDLWQIEPSDWTHNRVLKHFFTKRIIPLPFQIFHDKLDKPEERNIVHMLTTNSSFEYYLSNPLHKVYDAIQDADFSPTAIDYFCPKSDHLGVITPQDAPFVDPDYDMDYILHSNLLGIHRDLEIYE